MIHGAYRAILLGPRPDGFAIPDRRREMWSRPRETGVWSRALWSLRPGGADPFQFTKLSIRDLVGIRVPGNSCLDGGLFLGCRQIKCPSRLRFD
jgi:hypothetical protein